MSIDIRTYSVADLHQHLPRLAAYAGRHKPALSFHPGWLTVLQKGFGHTPYCLEALDGQRTCGILALAYVRSWLFGRFLVSLPYLNYGGVLTDDTKIACQLVEGAAALADSLDVRYLELRHERPLDCDRLGARRDDKVNMRLELPATTEALWKAFSPKARNQVRNGMKNGLTVAWGGQELLAEFYAVFRHNMRDLGTPVYGRALFRSILEEFPKQAEFCVVRLGTQAVAAALLLHGAGVTEVPSASSLRRYNSTCANMLMYAQLLERAVQRGQALFDFGRASMGGNTYRFKKQWGAQPDSTAWQYYVRAGTGPDLRSDNPRYQRFIRLWQRLPVPVASLLGPPIVRGIP